MEKGRNKCTSIPFLYIFSSCRSSFLLRFFFQFLTKEFFSGTRYSADKSSMTTIRMNMKTKTKVINGWIDKCMLHTIRTHSLTHSHTYTYMPRIHMHYVQFPPSVPFLFSCVIFRISNLIAFFFRLFDYYCLLLSHSSVGTSQILG